MPIRNHSRPLSALPFHLFPPELAALVLPGLAAENEPLGHAATAMNPPASGTARQGLTQVIAWRADVLRLEARPCPARIPNE